MLHRHIGRDCVSASPLVRWLFTRCVLCSVIRQTLQLVVQIAACHSLRLSSFPPVQQLSVPGFIKVLYLFGAKSVNDAQKGSRLCCSASGKVPGRRDVAHNHHPRTCVQESTVFFFVLKQIPTCKQTLLRKVTSLVLVSQWIIFKILVLTFRALHHLAPPYLTDVLSPTDPPRSLTPLLLCLSLPPHSTLFLFCSVEHFEFPEKYISPAGGSLVMQCIVWGC